MNFDGAADAREEARGECVEEEVGVSQKGKARCMESAISTHRQNKKPTILTHRFPVIHEKC